MLLDGIVIFISAIVAALVGLYISRDDDHTKFDTCVLFFDYFFIAVFVSTLSSALMRCIVG